MNRARVFLTGLCLVVGLATPLQAISLEGRDQSPSFALDTRTLEGRSPSGPFVLDTRTLEGRSQSLSFTLDTRTLEGRGQSLPFVLNTSPGLFLVLKKIHAPFRLSVRFKISGLKRNLGCFSLFRRFCGFKQLRLFEIKHSANQVIRKFFPGDIVGHHRIVKCLAGKGNTVLG